AIPLSRRVGLGFIAAALPDLDIVTSWMSPLSYLYYHRGITHSLIVLPLWSILLAWLCSLIWRRGPPWRAYFGVFAWGIGIHIAGDWITSFGTMIFAPFSDARYGLATTFIIDLWFTGIILAGLLAAVVWRRSRAPAVAGLAVLACYVGLQYTMQQRAIDFGEAYARSAGIRNASVAAQPRPVSPFNWMVVVTEGERYHYSLVNLLRDEPLRLGPDAGFIRRLSAPYLPLTQAVWNVAPRFGTAPAQVAAAREAWKHPRFAFFRWFAQYPVLYKTQTGNPELCVWFHDLRFFTPGRSTWPFRYGLCREAGGEWLPFQLVGESRYPVY
ncbi:MAG TPA: metal-dependent hydrolase, partial [Burkholderiales bacterium]|nr:metal-dependent hydrolase [Burkholderiales bacterium]